MPKRKYSDSDDSEKIMRKIKRMEKKLKKRKKRSYRISSSSSIEDLIPCNVPVPLRNDGVDDMTQPHDVINENVDLQVADIVETCTPTVDTQPTVIAQCAIEDPTTVKSIMPETMGDLSSLPEDKVELDDDILTYLGETPSRDKKLGPKIQSNIASRWEHVATSGVTREDRKQLQEKYLTPENCVLIDPPLLNLEVKAALSDTLQKKDAAIQNKQKQISAAVSCIGHALKRALLKENKDPEMIKYLIDAGCIICDVQHTESLLRRGYVGSYVKNDVKDHLHQARIDKFLFGENLAETLRVAKSISKSGSEIRATPMASRQTPKNKVNLRPLNLKGPVTTYRPLPAGRRFQELNMPVPQPPPPPPRRPRRPPPPPPAPARRSQQQRQHPHRR